MKLFSKMAIETDYIICDTCSCKFERGGTNKHCSNCFACSGCEIYYCPSCDREIVVTPVKRIRRSLKVTEENNSTE
jgi:hypothetical protein